MWRAGSAHPARWSTPLLTRNDGNAYSIQAADSYNDRSAHAGRRFHPSTHPTRGIVAMERDTLIEQAKAARERAYAPYSRFKVGAALQARDGTIFHGCNVENASYGLCNCAERTAMFSAIAAGYRPGDFARLAVVGDTDGPIAPCGACRQVIVEIGTPDIEVILSNLKGAVEVTTAQALLPGAFRL
nr:cytidine deaminase [Burkholderia stagnalis]